MQPASQKLTYRIRVKLARSSGAQPSPSGALRRESHFPELLDYFTRKLSRSTARDVSTSMNDSARVKDVPPTLGDLGPRASERRDAGRARRRRQLSSARAAARSPSEVRLQRRLALPAIAGRRRERHPRGAAPRRHVPLVVSRPRPVSGLGLPHRGQPPPRSRTQPRRAGSAQLRLLRRLPGRRRLERSRPRARAARRRSDADLHARHAVVLRSAPALGLHPR